MLSFQEAILMSDEPGSATHGELKTSAAKCSSNWDEESLLSIAASFDSAIAEHSDRKKSAEQRATSILTGSAFSLTLMFTAVSIAFSVKQETISRIQSESWLSILIVSGIVFLTLSDVCFMFAVWCAAHTLRPREISNYSAESYKDLPETTRKALLIEKIESLAKAAKVWDSSASGAVTDLHSAISFFKWALIFLFLTIILLALLLLSFFCPVLCACLVSRI
jgi:hypothetical protein